MLHWDPDPTIFFIPYLHWPIRWYGLFFASGFILGFPLFVSLLRRFFFFHPKYIEEEILCPHQMSAFGKSLHTILKGLNHQITDGVLRALSAKIKKFVTQSHCPHPAQVLSRLGLDRELGPRVLGLYRKATMLTDRFVLYMLLGTVIGARLGHLFFYEDPSRYWGNFREIVSTWEGGLASHGAAIGIMIALLIFRYRIRKIAPTLTWMRLLDFVSIPTALCGCFIRIGNFFNQEIVGTPSMLFWAVTFGHPLDGSPAIPRHPVQLYEAAIYLSIFCLLWRLSYLPRIFAVPGRLIGLFLILVFGSRIGIEFFKLEQSDLTLFTNLTMGQILSIPLVFIGIYFCFHNKVKILLLR